MEIKLETRETMFLQPAALTGCKQNAIDKKSWDKRIRQLNTCSFAGNCQHNQFMTEMSQVMSQRHWFDIQVIGHASFEVCRCWWLCRWQEMAPDVLHLKRVPRRIFSKHSGQPVCQLHGWRPTSKDKKLLIRNQCLEIMNQFSGDSCIVVRSRSRRLRTTPSLGISSNRRLPGVLLPPLSGLTWECAC